MLAVAWVAVIVLTANLDLGLALVPPPYAKGRECPFDLAVQKGRPDAGLDRNDADLLHGGSELLPELRAVVSDDEPGFG